MKVKNAGCVSKSDGEGLDHIYLGQGPRLPRAAEPQMLHQILRIPVRPRKTELALVLSVV